MPISLAEYSRSMSLSLVSRNFWASEQASFESDRSDFGLQSCLKQERGDADKFSLVEWSKFFVRDAEEGVVIPWRRPRRCD